MKTLRTCLIVFVLASGAGFLTGCATDNPDNDNISQVPWNQPSDWEGPLPSTINQGR